MNKTELICRLKKMDFDKNEYWLITGGAMVLYGIKEETGDIDLGCSKRLADELEKQGYKTTRMSDGTRRIEVESDIEIFEDWLFDKVELVENIPVISLAGLLAMKKDLSREKDYADIKRIEAFIREKDLKSIK
ncbi:MAG: hypothetical protein IJY09_08760 [Lachnospiraceae bacterium]|nr:hypothetical protein [Lachnospiraceae bacterium]